MDDLENDKIIYWVIFFGVLILIAVLGHHYVFSYTKSKEEVIPEKKEEEIIDLNSYVGIWQIYGDDELPMQELCINVIDGATITFDFFVNEVAYFESQTAVLVDNVATFSIKDREENASLAGKITLKNDKVFLGISSSSLEEFGIGTIEFSDKSTESLLD